MLANDPGLGNKYRFIAGRHKGKIGYWAGCSDEGPYIEWDDGRFGYGDQEIVRWADWDGCVEIVRG